MTLTNKEAHSSTHMITMSGENSTAGSHRDHSTADLQWGAS